MEFFMNKRLFNLVLSTIFLLSAVMPASSMGFARRCSGYASVLTTAARGAAQRFTGAVPQATRGIRLAHMRGVSLNVKDALQKQSSSRMHELVRQATRPRAHDNFTFGIGQRRNFSMEALSAAVSTDAFGLIISAAAAAVTAWYMDDVHNPSFVSTVDRYGDTHIIVVHVDGKVAGYIQYAYFGKNGHIVYLRVSRKFRRQKIATQLLQRAMSDMKAHSVSTITLTACPLDDVELAYLLEMYGKHGFVPVKPVDLKARSVDMRMAV